MILINPCSLRALVACQLISVSKSPSIFLIGICKAFYQIIQKAIIHVGLHGQQRLAWRCKQGVTVLSTEPACEAALHAMHGLYSGDIKGICLVSATHTYSLLNQWVTSIPFQHCTLCLQQTCSIITRVEPFVSGETSSSLEGIWTTSIHSPWQFMNLQHCHSSMQWATPM